MELDAALICDAASVRENLLFVLGGGITRYWREEIPADLRVSLALVLGVHPSEMSRPHELDVILMDADGARLAELKTGFQVDAPTDGPGVDPTEPALIPQAIEFAARLPRAGRYGIDILLDAQHRKSLPFQLLSRTSPGPIPEPGG